MCWLAVQSTLHGLHGPSVRPVARRDRSFSLPIIHEAAAARLYSTLVAAHRTRLTLHPAYRTPRHHAARHTPPAYTSRRMPSIVRRAPPAARHPLPTTRLEGSSPRRAEQHGSSLSCDGTCSTPSTIAALPLLHASIRATPRAPYRATPYCAAPRHCFRRPRRVPCWLVPCQHRQRAITHPHPTPLPPPFFGNSS